MLYMKNLFAIIVSESLIGLEIFDSHKLKLELRQVDRRRATAGQTAAKLLRCWDCRVLECLTFTLQIFLDC
jgi:hypothetical protein